MRKKILVPIFFIGILTTFLTYKNLSMPKVENFEVQQFETKNDEVLIGIISDTHIPDKKKFLPEKVKEVFKETDLIIHAGDVTNSQILEELKKIAPVIAVEGNTDPAVLKEKLPEGVLLKIYDFKIGIVHSPTSFWLISHLPMDFFGKLAERLAKKGNFDILVSGHTHRSYLKELSSKERKILLINPGSPTVPFFIEASVCLLRINKNFFEAEIIKL